MQISRIYSNRIDQFSPIDFNARDQADILNVVYGAVTDLKDDKKDSHNLGKTTLVHLIDFMFLKDISGTKHFLETHADRFLRFTFFIEIALNSGDYLTIRRSVENNTQISLTRHGDKGQNLENLPKEAWDHPDVNLTAARELVDGILNLTVIKPYTYRMALSYFLRTQDDYNDVLQLQKFSIGSHVSWKPFVMTLLGFDERPIKRKYDLDAKIEKMEDERTKKQGELQVEESDLLRLDAEIQNLNAQLVETEAQLDRFEFSAEERRLMHELVDVIEARISEINEQLYNIRIDLRNIDASLASKMDFDLAQVQEIFAESEIHFQGQLKKSYEDLVAFNREITVERNRTLRSRRKELEADQEQLRSERAIEDAKRQEYQSILRGSVTLEKFKALQRNLADQRAELTYLEGQRDRLSAIADLESEISALKRDRSLVVDEIKAIVSRGTAARQKIAENFNAFCRRVLDHEGLFYVRQNATGNVEFPVELKERGSAKASRQSEGKSYKQLLCALFDLSILKAYEDAAFYHFVYHDGILEGLDDRKKRLFLEVVHDVIRTGKTQYILSVIDADVPRDADGKRIEFSSDEIVLRLNDSGDDGRLFKMAEF
ncbi:MULTISPECIES: DUF2326 domain-containing protein [unclassified Devosia]|uniref:DUF2326 domain-containing protein n=1 Tax=unclassified Devosia TaxID=196773 RepID=UPI00086DFB6B|nr:MULTISPECIES: DUF2326 domain-containing protein [unclassified Devosia]MBN9362597.1 DUF2326 domain-containing protein [Devosia sp.]ODS83255.1 MAG: hypothetical protein ABS47_20945 [Devosia sp. SCN 66-27]OJX23786.1 MAG: hypothetical protein BGO83_02710 [Devosia sp. 66-14]